MTKGFERELDKALEAGSSDDPQLAPLVGLGRSLQEGWVVSAPARPRERRMFVGALAGRRATAAPALPRILVPALALSTLLLFLGMMAQTSLPGDVLWPVRRSLYQAGVFTAPQEAIEERLARARDLLTSARAAAPGPARRLALRALTELGTARPLLRQLEPSLRAAAAARIARLENGTVATLAGLEREEGEGGDDSSGPGSGDDSSGPGSGDDSSGPEDSSGPGGGDSSGPGSGDDSSGPEDSSGPGGGDSSGSGGGGSSGSGGGGSSGSGGGDSSGSGSG